MEDESQSSLASDLLGTVVRPPSIRVTGSFKSTLSGRLTPRSSPSFKRSQSIRTPVRESRPAAPPTPWYRRLSSRRLLPWLIVIGLWSYIGFLVQTRWAHNDGRGGVTLLGSQIETDQDLRSHLNSEQKLVEGVVGEKKHEVHDKLSLDSSHRIDTVKPDSSKILSHFRKELVSPSDPRNWRLWQGRGQKAAGNRRGKTGEDMEIDAIGSSQNQGDALDRAASLTDGLEKGKPLIYRNRSSWTFPLVGTVNDSVGALVGPFDEVESTVLGPIARKTSGFCESGGTFAGFVRGKTFMLVLHELSMTGSPLAMMELASEILSCGGKVSAVPLSKKGGLLEELLARGIKVLKNKASVSYKTAARADLLVAGSAVCASWIEKYLLFNKKGSKQLAWWIMENRREYFDRSKHLLGKAKVLIFLSESQSKQWQAWSQMEGIVLPRMIEIVPLSVNDKLSIIAGLKDLDGTMQDMRQQLRDQVRGELGLEPTDVLLTSLSSINPGKGQLKLLQAASMVVEGFNDSVFEAFPKVDSQHDSNILGGDRKLLAEKGNSDKFRRGNLKVLIGSVGSKSNKVEYLQKMLEYITDHPRLAKVILWTPATVHVAPLYSASDAYLMNSQGIGETFGRVTVEAMAFGLPILGTDAGGTREIVEDNVTGLLHPIGTDGVSVLAQHIDYLLSNPTLRKEMGFRGRAKVTSMYLKGTMYDKLAKIFIGCHEEGLIKRGL